MTRAADRDLDAVLALFEAAARFADDLPPGSPQLFLDSLTGQEIAGDTLAEQAVREDCVRVLTAHRSKGLEWDVVVVAGVQEEVWPDLRLRGSLLGADELADATGAAGGAARPPGRARQLSDVAVAARAARLLAEERRLFYVAATRARQTARGDRLGRRRAGPAPVAVPRRAGRGRRRDRAGERRHPLAGAARARRGPAPDRGRPGAAGPAQAGRGRASSPGWRTAGVRGADPGDWYALTELSDAAPVVARRRAGPAVAVARGDVHPLRPALAA